MEEQKCVQNRIVTLTGTIGFIYVRLEMDRGSKTEVWMS